MPRKFAAAQARASAAPSLAHRPVDWSGLLTCPRSGGGFNRRPGVLLLELNGAQVPEGGV